MSLGKAVVNIMANLGPLKRGLMNAHVAVKKMVSSMAHTSWNILSAGLKKIISLAKLAGLALLGIGVASVKIAMDAEETENLFVESMGSMTDAAREWVKEYSKAMGLFETDTKKGVATLNVMLGSMGLGADEAFNMSKQLVTLANDMASFYNLKPEEAFIKLQAGITGEAEGLKRLGILIGETTLKHYQMSDATLREKKELTELEKVQLRYKAILEQTKKAQGDLGRTLDSTTNVFRTIKAQVFQAANNIGNVFMPMVTKAATAVRDWLQGNQEQIIAWSEVIRDKIQVVMWWIEDLIALGKGGQWQAVFTEIGNVIGDAIRAAMVWVKQFMPLAVDLGKKIGEGFWAAIENTPFGEFVRKTGSTSKKVAEHATGQKGILRPNRIMGEALGTVVGYGVGGAYAAHKRQDGPHSDLFQQARKEKGAGMHSDKTVGDVVRELIRTNKLLESQIEMGKQ